MNDIIALLKCFGDRYINCDNDQAVLDAMYMREDMVATFNAILHFAETKEKNEEKSTMPMTIALHDQKVDL